VFKVRGKQANGHHVQGKKPVHSPSFQYEPQALFTQGLTIIAEAYKHH
jgi:hypothetical protein